MASENEEKIAEQVLRAAASVLGGMLIGGTFLSPLARPVSRGLGKYGKYNTGTATRILEGAAPGTVSNYPTPRPFIYNVNYIDGAPQYNAAYKANPNPRAMRMQTLQEHNHALNKYIKPGMTPLELRAAIKKGEEEERKLASFWTNDTHPRRNVRSSSSAVSDVVVNSDGTISVRFRNKGNWYLYRGGATPYEAAMAAHDLVTAPSLGRAINKKTGWWSVGDKHKLY